MLTFNVNMKQVSVVFTVLFDSKKDKASPLNSCLLKKQYFCFGFPVTVCKILQ